MRVADAERIARAGGEPAVELVLGLLAEIRELRERLDEHDRLLKQDSRNSSKAPSNDPPLTRQQRRQLARERAKKNLQAQRKQGAQPGHPGSSREPAEPEQLTAGPLECLPERCGCGYRFVGGEERVGEPVAHQQWELPLVVPDVREWRRLRLVCPCCGKPVVAELPAGVSLSPFEPRLHAHVAVLAGVCRLSREKITELLLDAYGITVSVGAVDTMIRLSGRSSSWPTPSRYGADASGAGAPRFGLRTLRARRQSGLA